MMGWYSGVMGLPFLPFYICAFSLYVFIKSDSHQIYADDFQIYISTSDLSLEVIPNCPLDSDIFNRDLKITKTELIIFTITPLQQTGPH